MAQRMNGHGLGDLGALHGLVEGEPNPSGGNMPRGARAGKQSPVGMVWAARPPIVAQGAQSRLGLTP